MKIKKIIDLCKKRGIFRLYAGESVQWISDGCALYPLYNLPEFDEETLHLTPAGMVVQNSILTELM